MKKILLMLAFILTAGIVCAANQPKMTGKVLRHGETYLDFSSTNKGVYSFSDGSETITRTFTWSAKLMMQQKNYSDGPVYKWQITVKIVMSYGTKELKFYVDAYEDGSLRGNSFLCSDGSNWTLV